MQVRRSFQPCVVLGPALDQWPAPRRPTSEDEKWNPADAVQAAGAPVRDHCEQNALTFGRALIISSCACAMAWRLRSPSTPLRPAWPPILKAHWALLLESLSQGLSCLCSLASISPLPTLSVNSAMFFSCPATCKRVGRQYVVLPCCVSAWQHE